jgi:hypothetical protein
VRRLPATAREAYSEHITTELFHTGGNMQKQGLYANPFALMMDPKGVLEAMERSERLNRLQSRVCRPLDKPLIPMVNGEAADQDFDDASDSAE